MIDSITGSVSRSDTKHLYISVQLGAHATTYAIRCPLIDIAALEGNTGTVELFIHKRVTINGNQYLEAMYGFTSLRQRVLFLKICTVNGVGPSAALAMLDMYTEEEILSYVASMNLDAIQAVKGVGKKTAEKLILDLSDWAKAQGAKENEISKHGSKRKVDAIDALVALGKTKKEALDKVNAIWLDVVDSDTASAIITKALRA